MWQVTHARAVGFGGSFAADIPMLIGRVGSDDEEIGAGFQVTVTGSGGENGYVSGVNRDFVAVFAAER